MKILCFGDSNTYGYDPRSLFGGRYPAEQRWADQLAILLDSTVINCGESGREIPRREAEWCSFERVLNNAEPIDLVIIMLGTNDLLQGNPVTSVIERMEQFLARIPLERSKILLLAPPPMHLGEWVDSQDLIGASAVLGNEYKDLSERFGVSFADTGVWNIRLTFDGVHFTEEGHRALAEGIADYLKRRFDYA